MIIIADSGSTKTDWCITDGNTATQVTTAGLNPYFNTDEQIADTVCDALKPFASQPVEAVYFYGAGCAFGEPCDRIRQGITRVVDAPVEVCSDLLGAARSACGYEPGIVSILGTGSSSAQYDGERIVRNVPSLGYILGDEGSGAVLGRLWIGDCLKNQVPAALSNEFIERYRLTLPELYDRIYKQPYPNRYLASFVPFLSEHKDEPAVHRLVLNAFKSFWVRNVLQYEPGLPVHFIGSVAYHFADVLHEAASALSVSIASVEQSPMPGLIRYHAISSTRQ